MKEDYLIYKRLGVSLGAKRGSEGKEGVRGERGGQRGKRGSEGDTDRFRQIGLKLKY